MEEINLWLFFFSFWIFVSEDTFPLRLQYKFYLFIYLIFIYNKKFIYRTAEEVEMENAVPMSSLPTKHHACRWPSPSFSCLGADGASTGTGPVQGKDTSPAQLWRGRGGQSHIPTGFSKEKKRSLPVAFSTSGYCVVAASQMYWVFSWFFDTSKVKTDFSHFSILEKNSENTLHK